LLEFYSSKSFQKAEYAPSKIQMVSAFEQGKPLARAALRNPFYYLAYFL